MNPKISKIIERLKQVLEDDILSTQEKNQIEEIIPIDGLTKDDSNLLRSEIFKLAKNKVNVSDLAVIYWLEKANKIILKHQEKSRNQIYFSPGEECLNAILNKLRSTNNVLKICMFTISDNRITDEIVRCFNRGVNVKIVTDDEKMNDYGSDIHQLIQKGISVKHDNSSAHMHHKFAIIDNKKLLTGSFNWTRSATSYNYENIIITQDKKVVSTYNKEFDRLWKEF